MISPAGNVLVGSVTDQGTYKLQVNGAMLVTAPSKFGDDLEIDGELNANGIATFNSDASYNGTTDFNGTANMNGTAIFNGESEFNNAIQFSNSITVDGESTFDGTAVYNNAATFNGEATFNNLVAMVGGVTSAGTVQGAALTIDNGAGYATFSINNTGKARWSFFKDSTSESGSNAGGNFQFNAVADDGETATEIYGINRASYLTTFYKTVTITGAVTAGSTLAVTGATTLSSTLVVTGALTANSSAAIASSLTVGGAADVVGNFSVGSASLALGGTAYGTTIESNANGGLIVNNASGVNAYFAKPTSYNNGVYVVFNYNASNIGQIGLASTSSVSYGTTSDYRLKENVKVHVGALDRVMLTKPIRYNFIADERKEEIDGFLAHEIAEVVPNAVFGIKDAVFFHPTLREGYDPADVQPEDVLDVTEHVDPQMIDHSKLVPLLYAALQEATMEIRTLKKRFDEHVALH